MKKRAAIFSFLFLILIPALLYSQTPDKTLGKKTNTTLSETLSKKTYDTFGDDFKFERILSMEKLPEKLLNSRPNSTTRYAIEFSMKGKQSIRLPAKVSKHNNKWLIDWLPKTEYFTALKNLIQSKQLTQFDQNALAIKSTQVKAWTQTSRLPTFPLIVTSQKMISPFGVLEKNKKGAKHTALRIHIRKWLNEILGNDPAPASFEIITPATTQWIAIHRIMIELAGIHGFFEMHWVGVSKNNMVSLPLLASIGKMPAKIIAVSRIETVDGLILTTKNGNNPPQYLMQGCSHKLPEGKYCSAEKEPIPLILNALFPSKKLEPKEEIMFGISPSFTIGEALRLIAKLATKLNTSTRRFTATMVVE